MTEDNLEMPFETTVLGVRVTVRGVTQTESGIVADCVRDGQHQGISIVDLPLPESPPKGADGLRRRTGSGRWYRHAPTWPPVTSGCFTSAGCWEPSGPTRMMKMS
jgi:hypothetical protein